MRRILFVGLLSCFLSVPLLAQNPQPVRISGPTQPAPPRVQPETPKDVPVLQKLRYICKQLDLDDRQWQHVEGLFAILEAESTMSQDQTRQRMELIMSTYHEMQAAQEAGDTKREAMLREELRGLAPGVEAERKFVEGLTPALKPAQQARLTMLLDQLRTVKTRDLELKPIDVVRVARQLDLDAAQHESLRKITSDFRASIATASDSDQQKKLLDKLIADIAAICNAEQKATFEREIDKRRLDPTPPPPAPAAQP